jgi:hypothetical protein
MKRLVRVRQDGRGGIVPGEHVKHDTTLGFECLRGRPDVHVIYEWRRARRDRFGCATDFNETQAAGP